MLTQPTHATLFTGKHPWQHGVTRNGQILLEERRTVAEELREAGFATRAVVASFPLAGRFWFHYFDPHDPRMEIRRKSPCPWSSCSGLQQGVIPIERSGFAVRRRSTMVKRHRSTPRPAGTSPVLGMRRSLPNRSKRFYAFVDGPG